jgi:hypothetical protein
MAAPDNISKQKLLLTSLIDNFDLEIITTYNRKKVPIRPRVKAITLEDKGIYLTNTPIVPKINIEIANLSFGNLSTSLFRMFAYSLRYYHNIPDMVNLRQEF